MDVQLRHVSSEEDMKQYWILFDNHIVGKHRNSTIGQLHIDTAIRFFSEEFRTRTQKLMERETSPMRLMLIECNQKPVGLISYVVYEGANKRCALLEFGLSGLYRSQGVGSKAYRLWEQHVEQGGGNFVEVVPSNHDNLRFYKRLGFSKSDQTTPDGAHYYRKILL
ncbi:MAG: GNAT family N-acetyltransferase [Erysipelotrichaceae bacterium]